MFLDTNVLVYARIVEAPLHHTARSTLERVFQEEASLRISRQIIREYLATVTRTYWPVPIPIHQALDDVDELLGLVNVLEDGPVVTRNLLQLCRQVPVAGRRIHDANIVATMLAHGERRLLTYNTSDFSGYGDRIELVDI